LFLLTTTASAISKGEEMKVDTQRQVVDFNPENYPAVLKALRNLGDGLVESDLDRKSGKLILVVTKDTSLDPFKGFNVCQGEKMDRRLKVKVTPMTLTSAKILQVIHERVIGDFASDIQRTVFKKDEYLTILFANRKRKEEFVVLIKANFPADVTLKS
jgi:hypothetical protein